MVSVARITGALWLDDHRKCARIIPFRRDNVSGGSPFLHDADTHPRQQGPVVALIGLYISRPSAHPVM
jgi:hypothetical protein